MTRLKNYKLSDPLIDVIVQWIVDHHDAEFSRKLTPDAIFWEMGESNRDFYFHFSNLDPYEAWEENILHAFEGVYLCAPAQDRNTYMPSTLVRQFFQQVETRQPMTPEQTRKRSLDIKQYISERSFLILRATPAGYYHAAEFPYSALFPPEFETLDLKMVYEGIGIASGNSIRVFLRECLSRVGKSHSILIHPKGNESAMPHGISLYTGGEVRAEVRADWTTIDPISFNHLKEEFREALSLDYYLQGNAQIEVSPVPNLNNRVVMTFAREHVYHKKPDDFLRRPAIHFVRPDIVGAEQIERILNHPLGVGTLK